MIKVSVIIPTYNRAHVIERAVNGALRQTLHDIEVLVCDDASTDSTRHMVLRYSEQDSRVKYLSLKQNGGAGAARNLGMTAAQGEYIAFLDSDDEWLPNKLELQVERMDSEPDSVGICFVGATIIKNVNADNIAYYDPDPRWEADAFLRLVKGNMMFLTPTILFRRSCIEKVGLMKEEMRRNQDGEFLLRLLSVYDLAIISEKCVIVNLDIAQDRKHFDAVKKALPHRLANTDLICHKLGRWPAVVYRMNLYSNLVCAALAERRSREAVSGIWQRLRAFPLLYPKDIWRISRAFAKGYLFPLYSKIKGL